MRLLVSCWDAEERLIMATEVASVAKDGRLYPLGRVRGDVVREGLVMRALVYLPDLDFTVECELRDMQTVKWGDTVELIWEGHMVKCEAGGNLRVVEARVH